MKTNDPNLEDPNLVRANSDELNLPFAREVVGALQIPESVTRRYCKNPPLLEELAKKHGMAKERIFLEGGVEGVMRRVIGHRLRTGSSILLPELGYPLYGELAGRQEAHVETFQFEDLGSRFSYNMEDLLRKLRPKPDIAVVIDPESPLGFSIHNEELADILKEASPDTLVMLDQAHEGIRQKHVKDVTQLVSEHPNLLVARNFSKFYGLAGERVGYALCGEKVKAMIRFDPTYLGFPGSAQQLAIAALRSEEHYQRNAEVIREQKARFNGSVKKLDGYRVLETDGLSSVVHVPKEQSEFLRTQADAAKVAIRHLGDYHQKLQDWYRVTMCRAEHIDRVIDLFESVAWLYDLKVHNSDAPSIIHTRDAGYTVHRREIPYKKSGILIGTHRVLVPPGKNVPAHFHPNQDELFEFHSEAYVDINGKPFKVRPGDCVIVQAGEAHIVEALPDRFGRFVALRFPYEHTDKYDQTGKQVIHEKPPTEIK